MILDPSLPTSSNFILNLFDCFLPFVSLPTDVQSEAIPLILGGGDVLMAAETGSGKTGAFCLPVLQITWESLKALREGTPASRTISGSAGGESADGSSDWRMSVLDRNPALAISADGLRCQSRHPKEWHGCRAGMGVTGRGQWYFEAYVEDEGLCRVGFSTSQVPKAEGHIRWRYERQRWALF